MPKLTKEEKKKALLVIKLMKALMSDLQIFGVKMRKPKKESK